LIKGGADDDVGHAFAFYASALGFADNHDRLTAVAGYILAHKLEKVSSRDVARGAEKWRLTREDEPED
jgi:hypothetical protein